MPTRSTIIIIAAIGYVAAITFLTDFPLEIKLFQMLVLGMVFAIVRWLWHVENIEPIATTFAVIAALIALSAGAETVSGISQSLRGKHDNRTGIVANVTTSQAAALVNLERRRNVGSAGEKMPAIRGANKLEQGTRVWIHGADVRAVIPKPSGRERAMAAVRDAARGLIVIMTALSAAILLLGIRSGAPFSTRLVSVLVALGITLTFALPITSIMEGQLAQAAIGKEWVGMRPEGLTFTLEMPLIGIAVLALALVINRGVAMREELELTV
jgi:hypothetical protein